MIMIDLEVTLSTHYITVATLWTLFGPKTLFSKGNTGVFF